EANSRLAELDRVKTEFFSNVSHEFRTPLTLMLGPLEDELAERIAQPPAKRVRIETAYRNALRLLKLVNSLLDFSRVEAGRAQATYIPTDLALLTRELASMFRSATDKAELELIVECPDLPQPVYVDREMWEKIVFNLISNAFKHTFEGSIRVALAWRGEYVELEVSDTGVGIPAAELPRLFERFQRVKGTRSRSHEGTGIGLALVQELAALHGGGITVTSTPKHGTTFTVSIRTGKAHLSADKIAASPAPSAKATGAAYVEEALHWTPDGTSTAAPHEQGASQAAADGGPGAGAAPRSETPPRPRILLADDNADMRQYVSDLLGAYYEVTAVPDGEAALQAARETQPDLVLSDIMMPRLDGLGLLRALRADEATRRLPIILLSARAGEEASVGAMDAGADDYLVKPFTARELIARVRAHVELARERHGFERELERANQELRAVNRELDAFTRTVSHDLRTPLGAMTGFAEFLLGGKPGPLNEKQREYLGDILESGQRLSRLTEDLLRFAAAAHRPLARESVAVAALVHTIVDELKSTQPDRPMTVRIGALPDAHADPTLLRQVFANLIGNAFKFTRDRTRAKIEIEGHSDATTCTYCVRDNGVGFDMQDLERLFASFERARDVARFEGTGLGLAIVRDVIERHGGRICALGRPGEGAEFTLSLPR
ncbi:MAG: response regulator, partial [Gammaproteobacteria bacterium]|nr:response regulator [Gammaproteobacteria bacterium]